MSGHRADASTTHNFKDCHLCAHACRLLQLILQLILCFVSLPQLRIIDTPFTTALAFVPGTGEQQVLAGTGGHKLWLYDARAGKVRWLPGWNSFAATSSVGLCYVTCSASSNMRIGEGGFPAGNVLHLSEPTQPRCP